jgi:hypothetical protein
LDFQTHAPNLNPSVPPSVYTEELAGFAKMVPRPEPGNSRIALDMSTTLRFHFKYLADPYQDYLCHRLVGAYNCNLLEGIPKIGGCYSLFLRTPNETMAYLYSSATNVSDGFADYLGICQLTKAGSDFEWSPRFTYLPLITAGQQPLYLRPIDTLNALENSAFDPRRTILLPPEAQAQVQSQGPCLATIQSNRFSAHRLEFTVETSQTCMVSIAQSFYPAWHAYVDGQPTKIWPANYAFQALQVPAGRHHVAVVYEDKWFRWGLVVSLFSLASGLMLWMRAARRSNLGHL